MITSKDNLNQNLTASILSAKMYLQKQLDDLGLETSDLRQSVVDLINGVSQLKDGVVELKEDTKAEAEEIKTHTEDEKIRDLIDQIEETLDEVDFNEEDLIVSCDTFYSCVSCFSDYVSCIQCVNGYSVPCGQSCESRQTWSPDDSESCGESFSTCSGSHCAGSYTSGANCEGGYTMPSCFLDQEATCSSFYTPVEGDVRGLDCYGGYSRDYGEDTDYIKSCDYYYGNVYQDDGFISQCMKDYKVEEPTYGQSCETDYWTEACYNEDSYIKIRCPSKYSQKDLDLDKSCEGGYAFTESQTTCLSNFSSGNDSCSNSYIDSEGLQSCSGGFTNSKGSCEGNYDFSELGTICSGSYSSEISSCTGYYTTDTEGNKTCATNYTGEGVTCSNNYSTPDQGNSCSNGDSAGCGTCVSGYNPCGTCYGGDGSCTGCVSCQECQGGHNPCSPCVGSFDCGQCGSVYGCSSIYGDFCSVGCYGSGYCTTVQS